MDYWNFGMKDCARGLSESETRTCKLHLFLVSLLVPLPKHGLSYSNSRTDNLLGCNMDLHLFVFSLSSDGDALNPDLFGIGVCVLLLVHLVTSHLSYISFLIL